MDSLSHDSHPTEPINQTFETHIDTGGAAYINGSVSTSGGKFVAGDDFSQVIIHPDQPIPLSARMPAAPRLFIGRQAELRQLQAWLAITTPELPVGKMGLIYGPEGVGKSSLMRYWLTELRKDKEPPIIVHISLDRRALVGKQVDEVAWQHLRFRLDWQELAESLVDVSNLETTIDTSARYFPSTFRSGSCAWLALAAQLTLQSQQVQAALARNEDWVVDLRFDTPHPPIEALTKLLEAAAQEKRPIVLACEGVQHASSDWLALFKQWEQKIRSQYLPVRLLLEYAYPDPLSATPHTGQEDATLHWLRQRCDAPYFLADALYLTPLTRYELEELLLPGSEQYASDLWLMSHGMPNLLGEVLAWLRKQGIAQEPLPGYWQVERLPSTLYLFEQPFADPLQTHLQQSLQRSAAIASELGYALTVDDLGGWLNHAVWEGDRFHDQALALAVGWHGDALDDFLTVLDEALCHSEQHPQALLAEIEGMIELPYGDGQTRYLTRYRFVESLVAVWLRQGQDHNERLEYGQRYAQTLEAVYAPHHEQILDTLAALYQSLGLAQLAASYRERFGRVVYLAQEEAALTEWLPRLQGEGEQRSFVRRILRFYNDAHRSRHPKQLLPWLEQALALNQQLGDRHSEAATLNNIGSVYSALGDPQQALAYYHQALPMRRQVGDKAGEAATLNNIGLVYSALGDKQQALAYYQQTLPMHRQVGDIAGEAITLTWIGSVYSALGDQPQALAYNQQALPMHRQVRDKAGEANTLTGIGHVYSALGDQPQALAYYQQALPMQRQVGDKTGEANTLTNIGNVYFAQGDQPQALAYYQQALPIRRQVGDIGGEATTLGNIGNVYFALGDQQQALAYLQQALPMLRQVGDKAGEATTLTNIGIVYSALGDPQQALAYYQQALSMHRQVGNKDNEAGMLHRIAHVYDDLGDLQQAEVYFEQSVQMAEVIKSPDLQKYRSCLERLRQKREE